MSSLSLPHTPPYTTNITNSNNSSISQQITSLKRRKFIRDLSCMSIDSLVGAGMYGSVYKAIDKEKGDKVALKYIKMAKESEGFPVTAIREIKLLKAMNNENVIRLYDVITFQKKDDSENQFNFDDGSVFMVFEYMEFDLSGLLTCKQMTFTPGHIRCYAKQLFSGLHYMHRNHILHRDIKGANILIGRDNKLKIADWGLARSFYSETQKLTNNVVTIWYRCPELLLETTRYGPPIDIWSAGCLFAEMFTHGYPILPSDPGVPTRQLELIYQLCGTPTGETEERLKKCEGWDKYQFSTVYPNRIGERFASLPETAIDLIEKLLCLHPEKRINASAVLDHPYFWSDGPTLSPEMLPRISYRIEGTHEYEVQQKRMEDVSKRQQQQQQQPQQGSQLTSGRGAGPGRGHGHNHGHNHNHSNGHNHNHNHGHNNNNSQSSAPPPPPGASGRGRSRYRVVTRPNQQSSQQGNDNNNNNSTTTTTTQPPNVPPEVPTTISSSSDSIVPQHESAFRKLGS